MDPWMLVDSHQILSKNLSSYNIYNQLGSSHDILLGGNPVGYWILIIDLDRHGKKLYEPW